VPQSTVVRWLNAGPPRRRQPTAIDARAYAHLLGLYLGDGHIAAFPRTWCLRLYLDEAYPAIIAGSVESVRRVVPFNRVAVHHKPGCAIVQCYSSEWPVWFPQHGPGRKDERPIRLEPWQEEITYAHPRELVRGLIESDGSRHANPVRRPYNISIARREAVAALDEFVGPKR